MYARNFAQSKAVDNFSAKFAPKFVKAVVKKSIGNVAYELENTDGKSIGVYHLKDIKI